MHEKEVSLFRDPKKTRNLFAKVAGICLLAAIMGVYSLGLFDGVVKVKLAVGSIGLLAIMLFFFIGALLKLKDKSPLVKMDARRIWGRTTPLSKAFGDIAWQDVLDLRLEKVNGDTLLVLTVAPVPDYQQRLSRAYRGMAFDKKANVYNIMYTASELEVDAHELLALADGYWKRRVV